jgi:hypothetical protein
MPSSPPNRKLLYNATTGIGGQQHLDVDIGLQTLKAELWSPVEGVYDTALYHLFGPGTTRIARRPTAQSILEEDLNFFGENEGLRIPG